MSSPLEPVGQPSADGLPVDVRAHIADVYGPSCVRCPVHDLCHTHVHMHTLAAVLPGAADLALPAGTPVSRVVALADGASPTTEETDAAIRLVAAAAHVDGRTDMPVRPDRTAVKVLLAARSHHTGHGLPVAVGGLLREPLLPDTAPVIAVIGKAGDLHFRAAQIVWPDGTVDTFAAPGAPSPGDGGAVDAATAMSAVLHARNVDQVVVADSSTVAALWLPARAAARDGTPQPDAAHLFALLFLHATRPEIGTVIMATSLFDSHVAHGDAAATANLAAQAALVDLPADGTVNSGVAVRLAAASPHGPRLLPDDDDHLHVIDTHDELVDAARPFLDRQAHAIAAVTTFVVDSHTLLPGNDEFAARRRDALDWNLRVGSHGFAGVALKGGGRPERSPVNDPRSGEAAARAVRTADGDVDALEQRTAVDPLERYAQTAVLTGTVMDALFGADMKARAYRPEIELDPDVDMPVPDEGTRLQVLEVDGTNDEVRSPLIGTVWEVYEIRNYDRERFPQDAADYNGRVALVAVGGGQNRLRKTLDGQDSWDAASERELVLCAGQVRIVFGPEVVEFYRRTLTAPQVIRYADA